MQKITVFIGYADDQKKDKEKLESILNQFHNGKDFKIEIREWRYESSSLRPTRKQDDYNATLLESNIAFFLFGSRVGHYSKEELEIGYESLKNRTSNLYAIFVYFKNISFKPHNSSLRLEDLHALIEFRQKLIKIENQFPQLYSTTQELTKLVYRDLDKEIPEVIKRISLENYQSQVTSKIASVNIGIDTLSEFRKTSRIFVFDKIGENVSKVVALKSEYYCYLSGELNPDEGGSRIFEVNKTQTKELHGTNQQGRLTYLSLSPNGLLGGTNNGGEFYLWDSFAKAWKGEDKNPNRYSDVCVKSEKDIFALGKNFLNANKPFFHFDGHNWKRIDQGFVSISNCENGVVGLGASGKLYIWKDNELTQIADKSKIEIEKIVALSSLIIFAIDRFGELYYLIDKDWVGIKTNLQTAIQDLSIASDNSLFITTVTNELFRATVTKHPAKPYKLLSQMKFDNLMRFS